MVFSQTPVLPQNMRSKFSLKTLIVIPIIRIPIALAVLIPIRIPIPVRIIVIS